MEKRKSVQNLAESIHSLLGLKSHLTSAWVNSVCNIIKNAPTKGPSDKSSPTPRNFTWTSKMNVDSDVSKMKDELAALTVCINKLNAQRRQFLNEFLDLKGNIRVFCRVRPITLGEAFGGLPPVVAVNSSDVILQVSASKSKTFSFDKVFHPGSSQDEVFSEIEPVIKSVLDGYNACIFAFGQTGSGKTFTMEGTPDCPGVVPRAIEAIFNQAMDSNHSFLFSFSMLEIHLGNLKDLLIPQSTKVSEPMPPCLSIKTDPEGGIEIDNLVTLQVSNLNQALKLYRLGCRLRSTASTNSNKTSSRSHCMIRISVTCYDSPERRRETNKLWMIDLGGSERVLKTKAQGKRFEEGKAINLSLSALGDVMSALQRKKCHIPYRNSKLTQVLKDSLGEDSKNLMLVHVSPKEEDLCESLCSLNFATRVRSIHLGNEESSEARQRKEIAMSGLQQKMKQIENERQNIRRDMTKLTEKLEMFTGTTKSLNEQLDASHLSAEKSATENMNNKIGNTAISHLSSLPRFMRPTVCSTRKFGTQHRSFEEKAPVLTRRRSNRAESVTFPLHNTSDYNSDCSISRASCLVDLNTKNSVDNETEYSQDISECDIKMMVFPKQQKPPRCAPIQKSRSSQARGHEKRKANMSSSVKCLKSDDFLHLDKIELATTNAPRRKRVLAIPTLETKNRYREQNNSAELHCKKVHNFEFQTSQIRKLDNMVVEATRSFVNIKMSSKDLDKSKSISPSATTDTVRQGAEYVLLAEDYKSETLATTTAPADAWYDLHNQNNETEFQDVFSMQAVTCKIPSTDDLTLDKHNYCHKSPSLTDDGTIIKIDSSDVSTSISELQPNFQLPVEKILGLSGMEDLYPSIQGLEKGTGRQLLHRSRCRRALFMDNADQKVVLMPLVDPKVNTQITGIFGSLKQKIQTLYASALLGVGFQNLGYEHDFFYSLIR